MSNPSLTNFLLWAPKQGVNCLIVTTKGITKFAKWSIVQIVDHSLITGVVIAGVATIKGIQLFTRKLTEHKQQQNLQYDQEIQPYYQNQMESSFDQFSQLRQIEQQEEEYNIIYNAFTPIYENSAQIERIRQVMKGPEFAQLKEESIINPDSYDCDLINTFIKALKAEFGEVIYDAIIRDLKFECFIRDLPLPQTNALINNLNRAVNPDIAELVSTRCPVIKTIVQSDTFKECKAVGSGFQYDFNLINFDNKQRVKELYRLYWKLYNLIEKNLVPLIKENLGEQIGYSVSKKLLDIFKINCLSEYCIDKIDYSLYIKENIEYDTVMAADFLKEYADGFLENILSSDQQDLNSIINSFTEGCRHIVYTYRNANFEHLSCHVMPEVFMNTVLPVLPDGIRHQLAQQDIELTLIESTCNNHLSLVGQELQQQYVEKPTAEYKINYLDGMIRAAEPYCKHLERQQMQQSLQQTNTEYEITNEIIKFFYSDQQ